MMFITVKHSQKYFNIFICFIVKLEYYFTTRFIENNINLILFFKVGGYPRELWESAGMEMEEEFSPKLEMGTGNILNGGERGGKETPGQSPPR
jgi:hypothetical protein